MDEQMFAISEKALERRPFPHLVLDDCFEEDEFLRLFREFPSELTFQKNIERRFSFGRIDLQKGDPLFHEFLEHSDSWRELFEKVNSQSFFTYLLKTFGRYIIDFGGKVDLSRAKLVDHNDFIPKRSIITRVIKRVIRDTGIRSAVNFVQEKIHPDEYYIIFSIGWAQPGYYVGPHTDNRNKAIVLLIFFDDFPGEAGSLNLLERKTPKALRDCERYPAPEELRIFKNISSKANRCVGMLNTNNAYHSTVPWVSSKPRRLLYISLCKRYSESMWGSSYFERRDQLPPGYENDVEPLPEVPIDQAKNI